MQGTWVRALVPEDPTCCGATKPMCHNYWACAWEPQLLSPRAATTEACSPRARAPQQEKPPQWEALHTTTKSRPCSPQLEKARVQQRRPNTAKNKIYKINLYKKKLSNSTEVWMRKEVLDVVIPHSGVERLEQSEAGRSRSKVQHLCLLCMTLDKFQPL